jgi:hypothetical protein
MFEWLEHAWTAHDGGVTELLVNPFLRATRTTPPLSPSLKRSRHAESRHQSMSDRLIILNRSFW